MKLSFGNYSFSPFTLSPNLLLLFDPTFTYLSGFHETHIHTWGWRVQIQIEI